VYVLLAATRSGALVLTAEAMRLPGVFYETVVARSDVAAYRVLSAGGFPYLELHRRDGKKARVSLVFTADPAFTTWLDGITNLDAQAYEQSLSEVAADIDLGDSPEQRLHSIARARRVSRALTLLVWSTSAWLLFYPRPYALAIAVVAALPLLTLWLCWRYRGSFTLEDSGLPTARLDLVREILIPGFILTVRASLDFELLEATRLIIPATLGLGLLVGTVILVEPKLRGRVGKLILFSALLLPYPASVAMHANSLLSQQAPWIYRVPVISKRSSGGNPAGHYFLLPPWGPRAERNEVRVRRRLYEHTLPGQNVCVWLYAGALDMPFFDVYEEATCRQGSADSSRCAGVRSRTDASCHLGRERIW
jgi:hypothetical protein